MRFSFQFTFVPSFFLYLSIVSLDTRLEKRFMPCRLYCFLQRLRLPVALRFAYSTAAPSFSSGIIESCSLLAAGPFYAADSVLGKTFFETPCGNEKARCFFIREIVEYRVKSNVGGTLCTVPIVSSLKMKRLILHGKNRLIAIRTYFWLLEPPLQRRWAPWCHRRGRSRRTVPACWPETSCPRPSRIYSQKSNNPTRRPRLTLKPPASSLYYPRKKKKKHVSLVTLQLVFE